MTAGLLVRAHRLWQVPVVVAMALVIGWSASPVGVPMADGLRLPRQLALLLVPGVLSTILLPVAAELGGTLRREGLLRLGLDLAVVLATATVCLVLWSRQHVPAVAVQTEFFLVALVLAGCLWAVRRWAHGGLFAVVATILVLELNWTSVTEFLGFGGAPWLTGPRYLWGHLPQVSTTVVVLVLLVELWRGSRS